MAEKKQAKFYQAIGRRKESTATVRLFDGKGDTQVNGKPIADYFPSEAGRFTYSEPFRVTGMEDKFYATILVSGGGKTGQLDAIALAISRALVGIDEKFRKPLRAAGLMTRIPFEKERKKYFLRKARKRPQYSKR